MVSGDWNDFAAFGGTLKRRVLTQSANIQDDIDYFYGWLLGMRSDPARYGIPARHAGDVETIFQHFIISPDPESGRTKPSLRPFLDQVSNGIRGVKPITVRFGSNLAELNLVDGPSALGYLFSIVEVPSSANWENHWFPMLLMFSKWVPVMANIMYAPTERNWTAGSTPCMFGATLPAAPLFRDKNAEFTEQRGLTALWRRESILAPALNRLKTQQRLPVLDEIQVHNLSKALHGLIMGRSRQESKKTWLPLLGTQTKGVKTAIMKTSGFSDCEYVPPRSLYNDPRTKLDLRLLLAEVISLRYEGKDFSTAYNALLCHYLTPHVYRRVSAGEPSPPAEILSAEQQKSVSAATANLWALNQALAVQKLDFVKNEHELHEQYAKVVRTGRCAETYPTACISPVYFDSMIGSMDCVRGLAIEPRGIGKSSLFNTEGCTLATLERSQQTILVLQMLWWPKLLPIPLRQLSRHLAYIWHTR